MGPLTIKPLFPKVFILSFLWSLSFPPLLDALSFKIKPLVLSGDMAPSGEPLSFVDSPHLNQKGEIAFDARTTSGVGIYVANKDGINLLLNNAGVKSIAGSIVDPGSLGFAPLPDERCIYNDAPSCFRYQIIDIRGEQRDVECIKEFPAPLNSLWLQHLNDGLSFAFLSDSDGSTIDHGIAVFTSGSIRWASCPLEAYLILVFYENFPQLGSQVVGLTNAGAIGLTFASRSEGIAAIVLISGGQATITDLSGASAPWGGTIRALGNVVMNENQTFLVPIVTSSSGSLAADGLVLLRGGLTAPVAFKGMVAPSGRQFRAFSGVAMNNAEQVVFWAQLDDGSGGIFRREADGTLIAVAQNLAAFFQESTSLSINQNGEVAARFFTSPTTNPSTEIRLFSSTGASLKVVSSGDSSPAGGTFTRVDAPRVDDQGRVVFWATLSDGRTGIFVASGLEMDFVDPVPDLLSGPTITSDTSALANSEAIVEGIAADGVAQVVVRVKTAEAGTVNLSLVDANGTSLPASNLNGSLSPAGGESGAAMVSVPAADVGGGLGPMAFAAYHAPTDFAAGLASVEAALGDRTVFIKAKLTTSTGETVESKKPLTIIRPPVVLVHGLWSTQTTWDFFGNLSRITPDPRFMIFTVNYSAGDAFLPNADRVLQEFTGFVERFKGGANPAGISVAATQGDIVAHSMGGNVARTMVLNDNFLADETYGKGHVHKLITIDTPHLGSHLANRLVDSNIICRLVFWLSGHPVAGAVQDLAVGSSALQSLQESLSSGLPTHVLVGIASSAQEQSAEENFQTFAFGLAELICPSLLPSGGFQEIFGGPNDLLVSAASQAATGLSISGGSPPATVTNGGGIIHGVIPGLFTLGPDSLSRDLIDGQPTEVSTPNPQTAIDLLNQSVLSGKFAAIGP